MTGRETNQLLLASAVAGDKKTKEETLLLPVDVKLYLPLHIPSPITQAEAIARLFSSLSVSHYTHTNTHTGCSLELQFPLKAVSWRLFYLISPAHKYITIWPWFHSFIHTFTQLMGADTHSVRQTVQSMGLSF